MRLNYVANALSETMRYTGFVILVPVLVALYCHDFNSIFPFVTASLVAILGSWVLKRIVPNTRNLENLNDIKKDEALFIVAFSWIVFGLISAIPYLFYGLSPLNSLFEAVSGITTTGATILTHFDYPKAFFFWRAFTQWLGGLGIIVLFIAILPQFAVAGRQMFFAEAPGPTEDKFTPRIRNTASALWRIYLGLTVLEIVLLYLAKMPLFDAVCNSLSTLSAAGFSPNPESIMGYHSVQITWIVLVFMFFAGASFNLQYKVISQKKPMLLFKNEEFRLYTILVLFMAGFITVSLCLNNGFGIFKNFTDALFQVVSLATSTGSASADFIQWNYTSKAFLFVVMFMGSCASSAGGGIKMARWLVVFKTMKSEITKILHPNAIINIKVDGKTVQPEVARQIIVFVFFYFLIFAVIGVLLSIFEGDTVLGLTGAISALGNIGPSLAPSLGPMGSFDGLEAASKSIMIVGMLVGRLEIIPFLVMFQKDFWRA